MRVFGLVFKRACTKGLDECNDKVVGTLGLCLVFCDGDVYK